jgi:hypothetical protein
MTAPYFQPGGAIIVEADESVQGVEVGARVRRKKGFFMFTLLLTPQARCRRKF